jgi:hypothetical protein
MQLQKTSAEIYVIKPLFLEVRHVITHLQACQVNPKVNRLHEVTWAVHPANIAFPTTARVAFLRLAGLNSNSVLVLQRFGPS